MVVWGKANSSQQGVARNMIKDQFISILMLSPIFKWLERHFILKLQSYPTNNLDRNQTGFVAVIKTHVKILLLVEKLRNSKKRRRECCIFIDYKSAYNTINRNLLYRILKKIWPMTKWTSWSQFTMPCILSAMASVFTSRMMSTKDHQSVRLTLTFTWNMSLQRYSSDVLDLTSGTSYTLIYTSDSVTPAPWRVLGDTTWSISRLQVDYEPK
jgi:hypothetical protein